MTTEKLAEITTEVYTAMGLSELTDDHTDELISGQLDRANIAINEEETPNFAECELTRHAVRRALEIWQFEEAR